MSVPTGLQLGSALRTPASVRDVSVVLDDDPTGTQAVAGVRVLLRWSPETIHDNLAHGEPCVHLITNSRALTPAAAEHVTSEAAAAAADEIKILTISMGVMADTALMQQVADATGGQQFIVPGGSDLTAYQLQLLNVFQQIASSRPLKLISCQ